MKPKINAIIVEDIPHDIDTVSRFLREDSPWVNVIGTSTSLLRAEELIQSLQPDLVVLDIQFEEEGMTAFDLLKKLKESEGIRFQIIFMTAHSRFDYYTKAFEYAALHFITKPIGREDLKEALSRVKVREDHDPAIYGNQLNVLFDYLLSSFQNQDIVIQMPNGTHQIVMVNDILYLKADGKYTWVYLTDNRQLYADKNLGEYAKILVEDFDFFRIHHSTVINMAKVSSFIKRAKEIEISDNKRKILLPASRRRFEEFLKYRENNPKQFKNIKGDGFQDLLRRWFNRPLG